MRIAVVITGILCIWGMSSWAYVFRYVIKHGSYLVYEPVGWIIKAEFYSAVFFAVIGLACVIYAIVKK